VQCLDLGDLRFSDPIAGKLPENASSPLMSLKVSRSSASDIFETDAPRLGEISISTTARTGRPCMWHACWKWRCADSLVR